MSNKPNVDNLDEYLSRLSKKQNMSLIHEVLPSMCFDDVLAIQNMVNSFKFY